MFELRAFMLFSNECTLAYSSKDNVYLACKKVKINILLGNGIIASHISTVAMLIFFIRGAIAYDRMNPLAEILPHQQG